MAVGRRPPSVLPDPASTSNGATARRFAVLRRLWAFGGVSGAGWCLDTLVFTILVHVVRWAPGVANFLSAGLAVVFVFTQTHERVFGGRRVRRLRDLLSYATCQIGLVAGAAWLIGSLVGRLGAEPVLVKIAVTPLTFGANFVVMSRITCGARRGVVPS